MTLLLALLLTCLLPGLAGGVALGAFTSSDVSRPGVLVSRTLACGVSVWFLTSGLLARSIGLTETTSWAASIVLGVASGVVLSLPRCRAVLRQSRSEASLFAQLAALSTLAWLPALWEIWRTTWGPTGSTPWYYWSLGSQVAELGSIPATATEFGTTLPFLADYQLFSSGTAMMLLEVPDSAQVRVLQVVVLLSVVMVGCAASLLAMTFGACRLAALCAAPVAVGTGLAAVRLTGYRPEGLALGLLLLLIALCVDWFRHQERGSLAAGCLLGAVLAQVHGIALTTAGVLLVGVTASLVTRGGVVPLLKRAALTASALLTSVLALGLTMGGVSGTEHTGQLSDASGLADQTWRFYEITQGRPASQPPSNGALVSDAVTDLYGRATLPVALLVGVLVAVIVVATRRQPDARRILVFTGVSLLGLTAVGAVFALGWSGYVPRRTGAQRLMKEATLLLGPLLACAVAALMSLQRERPWSNAIGVGAVVVCTTWGFMSGLDASSSIQRQHPTSEDVAALSDLGVPEGSVVLANAYTEAFFEQVMGGEGLLDGRAPYTYPDVLLRANTLFAQAQEFYASPRDHLDFLTQNNVSYVMVTKRRSFSLGTSRVFDDEIRIGQLERRHEFEKVLSRPSLRVYRYLGDSL